MDKQLTLFECIRKGNKRLRTVCYPDIIICDTDCPPGEVNSSCSNITDRNVDDTHDSDDRGDDIGSESETAENDLTDELNVSVAGSSSSSCCGSATVSLTLHKPAGNITATDIAQTPAFPPAQPANIQFPKTAFGSRSRSFNPAWYGTYEWLEYSARQNACFCYPCRLFGSQAGQFSSRPESAFTVNGFRNWKHATGVSGILNKHANCHSHKQYKLATQRGSTVSECLGNARSEMIQKNRYYIKSLLEVLLLCSKQEISIRGHKESNNSMNRGNFLEILSLVAKHDPIVQHRLSDGPKNALYTSADIQNELLSVMASMVRESICNKIRDAEVYSVLADETKDCSKKEQLSIVLRYVDIESAIQYEHFISFVEATSLNAESLSTYIIKTLQGNRLDVAGIVSQGYDGASVMSGHCSGVQQRIKEVAPQAVYIHCYAHCLNLVLVDATRRVSDAADFFAVMETIYVFLSSAKAHTIYRQQQAALHPGKPVRQLQQLSDTRWACRYLAIEAVYSTYDVVLSSLEMITEGEDRVKAVEAEGMLHQIKSFKFLISLILFWRIFSCTKSLSDVLQSTTINLAKAAELVSSTLDTLQLFRSDQEWEKLYKYVTDAAALHDISIIPPRPQRNRQMPRRLRDGLVLEATGARDTLTTSQQFKISLYYPILDAIIAEMKKRFDDKNISTL